MIQTFAVALALLFLRIFGEPFLKAYSPDHGDALVRLTTVAVIISFALLLDRLARRFYWRGHLKRRSGRETPKLLQDLVTLLMLAIGLAIGLWWQEGLTLTGIAAASIAIAAGIGVALEPDIQDVFSGLAMNYEDSCGIGDWVTIDSEDLKEPIFGYISGLSWRSTFVTMEDGCRVTVPNHLFTSNPFINHSRPYGAKRLSVQIRIDFRIPFDRVRDLFLGEALKTTRRPGFARVPAPDVVVAAIEKDSTVFVVRFWYYPDKLTPTSANSAMLEAMQDVILKNELPLPVMLVERARAPDIAYTLGDAEIREGLQHADLFAETLNAEQQALLASHSTAREIPSGTVLMRQGDPPKEMYIILEGAVGITIETAPGKQDEVAISAAGDVVGEMSLMTGAARTATVTTLTRVRALEIPKAAIAEVLGASPELFERMSRLLAAREVENQAHVNRVQDPEETGNDILAKMRKFFSHAFRFN